MSMPNKSFGRKENTGMQSFQIPPERFITAPVEAILQELQGMVRSRRASKCPLKPKSPQ